MALIQFIAHSLFRISDLPKKMSLFIFLQNHKCVILEWKVKIPCFLYYVVRIDGKKLIDDDVWINLEESGRLICKPTHIRTQAISRATLGDNEYNKLLNILEK